MRRWWWRIAAKVHAAHAPTEAQSHMTTHAHARRRPEKHEIQEAQGRKEEEGGDGVGERRRYVMCVFKLCIKAHTRAGGSSKSKKHKPAQKGKVAVASESEEGM